MRWRKRYPCGRKPLGIVLICCLTFLSALGHADLSAAASSTVILDRERNRIHAAPLSEPRACVEEDQKGATQVGETEDGNRPTVQNAHSAPGSPGLHGRGNPYDRKETVTPR